MTEQPTQNGAVAQAVQAVADAIGENVANIHVRTSHLLEDPAKLRDVVLVDLTIGRPRFEIKLSYEMLGLHPENAEQRAAMNRTLSLPRGFLKPKGVLHKYDSIEGRARGLLDNPDIAIPTLFGRMVPVANYLKLKEQLVALQKEYFAAADADCTQEQWDEHYKTSLADWTLHGLRNHRTLIEANARAQVAGQKPVAPELPEDAVEFATAFAHRVLANLPSPTHARNGYTFDWSVEYMPPALLMAQDQMAAAQVLVETQAATEEARLLAKARAEMKLDAEKKSAAKRDELVEKVYTDVAAHIHDRVYGMSVDLFEALRRNDGVIPPSNQRQLAKVVDAVRALNVFDDEELNKQEQALRLMLSGRATPQADGGAYVRMLEKISAQSRLALHQMGRRPSRSAREFGVPDEPGELKDMLAARAPRRVRVQLKPNTNGTLTLAPRPERRPHAPEPEAVA